MLGIGSILAVAAIALVYLNDSGEQASFIGKISGISLVTFLLIFGALGSSLVNNYENRFERERLTLVYLGRDLVLAGNYSNLPESIIYAVAWEPGAINLNGKEPLQTSETSANRLLFLRPGGEPVSLQSLSDENQLIQAGNSAPDWTATQPGTMAFDFEFSDKPQRIMRYIDFPFGSAGRYDAYLFNQTGTVYEIGVSHFEQLENTHEFVKYLIFWVALSSLIVIILFPAFYRFNLVRPLNNLLAGVRQAIRGDLGIQIPVQYEDEIGFLTHSFNRLLGLLHQSSKENEQMNAELERRLEELRRSEEKFSKTFHSSPVSMVIQREDDQIYVDVNQAFTRVTGYSREEAVGRTPRELNLYPNSAESRRLAEAFQMAQGKLRNFEFNFRRKSGQDGTGLLSSEFIELKSTRLLLGIVMDITERKQAEEQIRGLHAEMERRVVARSRELSTLLDLAVLVSHEDNPDQIYLPVMERIQDISGLQAVSLFSYSPDKPQLSLEAQVGLEGYHVGKMSLIFPSAGFVEWLNKPRNALLLSDLNADTVLPDRCGLPGCVHALSHSLRPKAKSWA